MTTRAHDRQRAARGDWQTPPALALEITSALAHRGVSPRAIVEPTCGVGAFLEAAALRWPEARLRGYEVNPDHVAAAKQRLGAKARVKKADFFSLSWRHVFSRLPRPLLILGNPPWVTSAALGALGSGNHPAKGNAHNLPGLLALTGGSNFDVSESMILRLLEAIRRGPFTLAMLCKHLVARRVLAAIARDARPVSGSLHDINARARFGVAVDATLLTLHDAQEVKPARWPHFASLTDETPRRDLGVVDGVMTRDADAFLKTRHLSGVCAPVWRSGIKHDCAAVMTFTRLDDGRLESKTGGVVALEESAVFPLLKGSDVANGRWPPTRAVLVTQRELSEDPRWIATAAPETWRYLIRHRATLAARKSAIYKKRPEFSMFGVGAYAFAPWKVAIAGLYKHLTFQVVGPFRGRPVMLDDTAYFLPFFAESDARHAHAVLSSEQAIAFFEARIFWDDKRPINKRLLQSMEIGRCAHCVRDQ